MNIISCFNETQKLTHLNTLPQFPQVNSATPHSLSFGIASYLILHRWHFETYQRVVRKKSQLCFLVFISHFRRIFERISDICFIFVTYYSRFVSFLMKMFELFWIKIAGDFYRFCKKRVKTLQCLYNTAQDLNCDKFFANS